MFINCKLRNITFDRINKLTIKESIVNTLNIESNILNIFASCVLNS